MWWIVLAVALIVAVATYVTWIATRLDRLHARAAAASAALDAALVRRAAAAAGLANVLDDAGLRRLASDALDASDEDREGAENALTRGLRTVRVTANPIAGASWDEAVATSRKVSLTRHIHTDLVRDARSMRRRRLVRFMRLTRRHPVPAYFDIEDPQLTEDTADEPA